jgi:short-subunit dehydrogenase
MLAAMDLRNAHVLLTGASGGIGAALASALAARGARLTLTGRRMDVLDRLAKSVDGKALAADLSRPEEPGRLLAETGRVDVVIANAALPASGVLSGYSVDQIDRAIDVNLRAPIVMAKLAGEQMAARGSGHLVFISSLSGKSASAHMALYNATKFGLRGFALALREDLRPHGVGVSTVLPGPVRDTGMLADTYVKVPRLGTRSPENVAQATIRAIDKNRAEVVVAPWSLRFATCIGSLAPDFAAGVRRRTGGDTLMAAVSAAQRAKR